MQDSSNWDVIVVDDEPDNIGVVELVCEFNDIALRVASSGQICLKLMRENAANLLLIDIQMPEMDGFELLRLIHQHPEWEKTTTIAITAFAMEDDERRVTQAGFDGYITKPIDVLTLIDNIRAIIEQSGKLDV